MCGLQIYTHQNSINRSVMPTLRGPCLRLVGLLLLLHTVLLVQADIEQQQPTWLIRYKAWYKQHTLAMLNYSKLQHLVH